MKKIAFTLFMLFLSLPAFSQDVNVKNDIVYIDGKECLKVNNSDPNNVSLYDLNGNEIIFIKFIHNSRYGALYNKITFLDQKLSFTSKSYIFNTKLLVKKLAGDKTLENCALNPEKVERFVLKYDENVEVYGFPFAPGN